MSGIPKVSVIMPAYNAEKTIRSAIESVLRQTFGDLELIVILFPGRHCADRRRILPP